MHRFSPIVHIAHATTLGVLSLTLVPSWVETQTRTHTCVAGTTGLIQFAHNGDRRTRSKRESRVYNHQGMRAYMHKCMSSLYARSLSRICSFTHTNMCNMCYKCVGKYDTAPPHYLPYRACSQLLKPARPSWESAHRSRARRKIFQLQRHSRPHLRLKMAPAKEQDV